MRFRRRQRRWIAVGATLALLFGQLVVAAHACAVEDGVAQGTPVVNDASEGAAEPTPHCPVADAADTPVCKVHCTDAAQSDQTKAAWAPFANAGPAQHLSLRPPRGPSQVTADPAETFARTSRRRVVLFGVRLI